MSREQFAFKTKLGKSTVDKLRIGLFSDRTLAIVEEHTKLSLRPLLDGSPATAEIPSPASEAEDRARPADGTPSIAVLPFANLGGDPEQDYVADGLTEDVITALARLRWLPVIARNSTCSQQLRAWRRRNSHCSEAHCTSIQGQSSEPIDHENGRSGCALASGAATRHRHPKPSNSPETERQ